MLLNIISQDINWRIKIFHRNLQSHKLNWSQCVILQKLDITSVPSPITYEGILSIMTSKCEWFFRSLLAPCDSMIIQFFAHNKLIKSMAVCDSATSLSSAVDERSEGGKSMIQPWYAITSAFQLGEVKYLMKNLLFISQEKQGKFMKS